MVILIRAIFFIGLLLCMIGQTVIAEPILLGLGYDRARSGHGFDIHKVGDSYIFIFYTYDQDGQPEWFLGSGRFQNGVLSGDLAKYQFDDQSTPKVTLNSEVSGMFSLDFAATKNSLACQDGVDRESAEQIATFFWEINGESAVWCSEFLRFGSKTGNTPYLGGVWYAGPTDSGYGLTLAHMVNQLVVVSYYFDSSGQPRWVLGSADVNDDQVTLLHYGGYCRTCTPKPTYSDEAGKVNFMWDRLSPAGSGKDTANLKVVYPNGDGSAFNREFTMFRLSDGDAAAEIELPSFNSQLFYNENISSTIIQSKCINCHTSNGFAKATRLVFKSTSEANYQVDNLAMISELLDTEDSGYLLDKVRGVSHGGGAQLASSSVEYADLVQLFEQLGSQVQLPSTESLMDGVALMSWSKTLRRAAILLAGRLPMATEKLTADSSNEGDFRLSLLNLLSGEGFHQFLLEGANDRLLTNKWQIEPVYYPLGSMYYPELNKIANEKFISNGGASNVGFLWISLINYYRAIAREPLELIAYVVENDLPYGEILTANYTMVNPFLNQMYKSGLSFPDNDDENDWRKAINNGAITLEEVEANCDIVRCEYLSGGKIVDYKHAGVLNTLAYLARYPSTATNRNRARSRWTNYFFLGLDIEKSASRTIDPTALADQNNPTLTNSNCTVCHAALDPVAGAFQNYGNMGFYRDQLDGNDSLPYIYKFPNDGSVSAYQSGDTWYKDMRVPGIANHISPDNSNSLQWLAEQITADDRFAKATVKFWWPAIFGRELLQPPEDSTDSDFIIKLSAFEAQNEYIDSLAFGFKNGFDGRDAYNFRDLLVEIIMGPWFRAESLNQAISASQFAQLDYAHVGAEKLLSPWQMSRKVESLSGLVWGDTYWASDLAKNNAIEFGGINSADITERIQDLTPLMHNVAMAQANELACSILNEGLLSNSPRNQLFTNLSPHITPLYQGGAEHSYLGETANDAKIYDIPIQLNAGRNLLHIEIRTTQYQGQSSELNIDWMELIQGGSIITHIEAEDALDIDQTNPACGISLSDSWKLRLSSCWLRLPVEVVSDGNYQFRVKVWGSSTSDEVSFIQAVYQDGDPYAAQTKGRDLITDTLQAWYEAFLGIKMSKDSQEFQQIYVQFLDFWLRELQRTDLPLRANIHESIPCVVYQGTDLESSLVGSDPHRIMLAYIDTLVALMSDFRFIYE